ncbi:hypothetical protein PCANB_000876, partial [Pneumocystis canis]
MLNLEQKFKIIKKHNEVADEILIRTLVDVLKGSIYQGPCIAFLEEKCLKLAKMSKELAEKCINAEETCNSLIKIVEKKCETLKTEIKVALENKNNEISHLLEQCHFYQLNCREQNKPDCKKLREESEKKVLNIIPPQGPFVPIHPKTTLVEEIGLKELYREAAEKGVLIEELLTLKMDDF